MKDGRTEALCFCFNIFPWGNFFCIIKQIRIAVPVIENGRYAARQAGKTTVYRKQERKYDLYAL